MDESLKKSVERVARAARVAVAWETLTTTNIDGVLMVNVTDKSSRVSGFTIYLSCGSVQPIRSMPEGNPRTTRAHKPWNK